LEELMILQKMHAVRCRVNNAFIKLFSQKARYALAIESHLTPEEKIQLFELSFGKRSIVEIGSYLGASACCFGDGLASSGGSGRVYCIDTWQNDAMSDGNRDTLAEFSRNTAPFSHIINPVRGWSTEVVDDVARLAAPIDLLVIDGDHSYEGAKADWDSYKSLLAPGATVVFHDWGWAEDVMPYATRVGTLPNLWWAEIGALR
jgi:predicted O-methyltransferase YrrM